MKSFVSIFLAASTMLVAEDGQTLKTTDGEVYTHATITELRPAGVVVRSDTGTATVPYDKLPKDLQARYGYDSDELTRYLKQGIDGTYKYREDVPVYAGEVIELNEGRFTYKTFGDYIDLDEDRRPLQG